MRTFELRHSIWLDRPIRDVFSFFANAENLALLSPDWLDFRIHTPTPIEMRVGRRIDYRIRLRGVPIRWTSLITRWKPPHVFVDEQLRGPWRRWVHEHRFEAAGGGTSVTDRVRYSLWGGALAGIPTIEFRASIIIGSGSLSFEMIRALVEKLPVMVTPRWIRTSARPIAIEDVIDYLRGALDLPESTNRVMEIGGRDRASYQEIMSEYARQRGLRRWMIPVPVLSPRLSSLWLGLVTPLYARVGRALVESLRNETVVSDLASEGAFRIRPRGLSESIARALKNEDEDFARTRWCVAVSAFPRSTEPLRKRVGARLVDSRAIRVGTDDASAFRPIREIGGQRGWYAMNWLWRLRGLVDLMLGGPGMRRGRRDPHAAEPGDTIDFWRVEAFEPDHLLRLSAEMRLPGRAWLQFEVRPDAGATIIRQTAEFEPRGLGGSLYWYALYPAHQWIFRSMLRRIGAQACGGGG